MTDRQFIPDQPESITTLREDDDCEDICGMGHAPDCDGFCDHGTDDHPHRNACLNDEEWQAAIVSNGFRS